jgi:hypothetical protein
MTNREAVRRDHEAIRNRLAELAAVGGGRLTPAAVVTDAAKRNSPLHAYFEWDDKKAAHSHRIEQARALIVSVRVTYQTPTRTVVSVAYVHDPNAEVGEQGYRALEQIRTDEDEARALLVQEFGRVASMLERAREIAAACDATEDIDSLLRSVVGMRERHMQAPMATQ